MLAALLENILVPTLFSATVPYIFEPNAPSHSRNKGRIYVCGWPAHRLEYCRCRIHGLPFMHAKRVAQFGLWIVGLRVVDRGLYLSMLWELELSSQ
jgi:hypothetical protein